MKHLTVGALCALFLSLPADAAVFRAGASFQVALVIKESCTVDSSGARPQVACQLASGYQLQPAAATASPAAPAALVDKTGPLWTLTF